MFWINCCTWGNPPEGDRRPRLTGVTRFIVLRALIHSTLLLGVLRFLVCFSSNTYVKRDDDKHDQFPFFSVEIYWSGVRRIVISSSLFTSELVWWSAGGCVVFKGRSRRHNHTNGGGISMSYWQQVIKLLILSRPTFKLAVCFQLL